MNKLNKLAHGIVLAFFGLACWLVWALLQLPQMVKLHGVELHPPAFTTFCMALGPGVLFLVTLPIVVAIYLPLVNALQTLKPW